MRQKRLIVAISIGLGLSLTESVFAQPSDAAAQAAFDSQQQSVAPASSSTSAAPASSTPQSKKEPSASSGGSPASAEPSPKKSKSAKTPLAQVKAGGISAPASSSSVVAPAQSDVNNDKKENGKAASGEQGGNAEKKPSELSTPALPPPTNEQEANASEGKENSSPEKKKNRKFLANLTINGQNKGTQFFVSQDGTVLVDAKALAEALGQDKPFAEGEPGVQKIKDNLFVDPKQAVAGSDVHEDDAKGSVNITLPGAAFATQKVYINQFAPIPPVSSRPSTFLNYSLGTAEKTIGSFYTNGGVAWGTSSITTSYSWAKSTGWQRGLTSYQHDDVKRMRRWTIGDQYVYSSDGLGGTTGLAGIGLSRAFDLNPYLITIPQPKIAGILQAPGTLEIYKNGMLVATRAVNAGPFDLENVGVGVGATDLKVIVRDPFGGTQELGQNFYAVQNTLDEGLTDFTYQIGIQSPQPGLVYETHRPAFLATQRWGLKHGLTLGYRFEGEKGILNGGGSLDWGNKWGGIHFSSAVSHSASAGQGWASNLAYSFTGRRFSFSVGGSIFSTGYRRLGDGDAEFLLRSNLLNFNPITSTLVTPINTTTGSSNVNDNNLNFLNPGLPNAILPPGDYTNQIIQQILASQRPRRQMYGNAGYSPFARTMIQAAYSRTEYADGHINQSESVGVSYDLHWASVYAGVNKSQLGQFKDKSVTMTLTIPLGMNTITAARLQQPTSTTNSLDMQRSLPTGPGYGYSVHLQNDSQSGNQGSLQFAAQNNLARLNLQYYQMPTGNTYLGQLSGSIVYIGHEVHFGRPLNGSYALVNVGDDLKGISVQHENQTVGTTNSHGSVLITDMLPYQRNQVGFTQSQVPPNYVVSKTDDAVSVPRYGGAVIKFGVHKLRAIRGVLKNEEGEPLAGGTITALIPVKGDKQELTSPMGTKGNFYLDNVPAGDYTIQAKQNGQLYGCPIMVPAQKAPIYNLKVVNCKVITIVNHAKK